VMSETSVKHFVRQALQGLAHIHSSGVAHRDIKADNILLTSSGLVKLADFGTAKNCEGTQRGAQTMIGTPFFMAPEILIEQDGCDEVEYGVKADVWSLGITVCELMNCGKPPWPAFGNPGQAFMHIAQDGNLPIIPDSCSAEARAFILRACTRNPTQRPTSLELLQDPWLAYDVEEILAADADLTEGCEEPDEPASCAAIPHTKMEGNWLMSESVNE